MTSGDKKRQEPTTPSRPTVVLMLATIADTTWRMFVPTLTLIPLGYWADRQFSTWPGLFIAGIVVGFTIAGLLIRQQLRKQL